jgi:hypothetical protein
MDPNEARQPKTTDCDPVSIALDSLRTELLFIDEYRGQFEELRLSDPHAAQDMLFHLAGTTQTALDIYNHLVELLLAGHAIDSSKPFMRELRLAKRRT